MSIQETDCTLSWVFFCLLRDGVLTSRKHSCFLLVILMCCPQTLISNIYLVRLLSSHLWLRFSVCGSLKTNYLGLFLEQVVIANTSEVLLMSQDNISRRFVVYCCVGVSKLWLEISRNTQKWKTSAFFAGCLEFSFARGWGAQRIQLRWLGVRIRMLLGYVIWDISWVVCKTH